MCEGSTRRNAPVEVQSTNGRLVARVRLNSGDVILTSGGGGGVGGSGDRGSMRHGQQTGTIIDVDDYKVR